MTSAQMDRRLEVVTGWGYYRRFEPEAAFPGVSGSGLGEGCRRSRDRAARRCGAAARARVRSMSHLPASHYDWNEAIAFQSRHRESGW